MFESPLMLAVTLCLANHATLPIETSDEELFAALDLERQGLEAAAAAWAEYLRARQRPTPHFDRSKWPEFIRRVYPQLVTPIVEKADAIVRGEIAHPPFVLKVVRGVTHADHLRGVTHADHLRGVTHADYHGRDIDWLSNPTKDTNYVSVVGSQWFMNPLGRAYLLTQDERYAEAFAWVFESWYDHQPEIVEHQGGLGFNPIYHAYYPGIHTRILVDNYYCLAASPALTPALHVKILKQLLASCTWEFDQNASYRPGNQQVGAVVGMGVAGLVFPEFKAAQDWHARAEARMREHLRMDFFPDGGHTELCTQYHKTCLRDMGYLALTAEVNGRPGLFAYPEAEALERAYHWLAQLVMPTGHTPALHSAVFATDWAIHLSIAARFFQRPDCWWLARRFWEKGLVPNQKGPVSLAAFMIAEGLDPKGMPDAHEPPVWRNVHLDTSGLVVLRDGCDPDHRFLLFQYGWAKSGHAYPGALSFILAANGELIATHPGSPLNYRHPAYRYCHSTSSHNLVTIDAANHAPKNRVAQGGVLEACAWLPGLSYFSAHHDGYSETFGAQHYRAILVIADGPVLIHDAITGGQGHTAYWGLHTPLDVSLDETRVATLKGRHTYRVCPARPGEVTGVKRESHWMAVLPEECQPEDCGREVPVFRYEKPIGPDGVVFDIAIFDGDGKVAAVEPHAVRVQTRGGEYVVLFGRRKYEALPTPPLAVAAENIEAEAECACVRFRNGRPDAAWVVDGKRLVVNGAPWLDQPDRTSLRLAPPR